MAKGFVGPRDRTAFLPPHLPTERPASHFVPDGHLLSKIPCTRYWGTERRQSVNGLPPSAVPSLLQKFDWVVGWEHGWVTKTEFPATVFCHPNALPEFAAYLKDTYTPGTHKGQVLAVGGEDTNLSAQSEADLEALSMYFERIFFEAKDIATNSVKTLVCGLNEFYVRGHEETFLDLLQAPASEKDFKVYAGWGAWWPHLDETIPDRAAAIEFSKSSPIVDLQVLPFDDYLRKLHRTQFMLCPYGNGVQAAKMIEALLMDCIPILTACPASLEMRAMGLPIMVVDTWNEIDMPRLEDAAAELVPRLESFRDTLRDVDAWWSFVFQ